ncbi:Non-specific lipid-transfer protein 6 [Forsythia ovata]|uniref:Non-specific lipid-transfer protein n=1 Tax=Forsythia ovata TaxID=205694 RepID=A0ABD1SKT7_9LAMI
MVKILCMLLVGMVVVAPISEAAISCGTVANTLAPCLNYVLNGGVVPTDCCNGISSLYNTVETTPDRRAVCSCLKSVAGSASAATFNNAASLPNKCGISIPYKLSPSIDCSKIQ